MGLLTRSGLSFTTRQGMALRVVTRDEALKVKTRLAHSLD